MSLGGCLAVLPLREGKHGRVATAVRKKFDQNLCADLRDALARRAGSGLLVFGFDSLAPHLVHRTLSCVLGGGPCVRG